MSLISSIKASKVKQGITNEKLVMAIVKAADDEVMKSAKKAAEEDNIKVILIDDKDKLEQLVKKYELSSNHYEIINETNESKAAIQAVRLVREGKVGAIMKGKLSTGQLLKHVVDKETGIVKSGLLTHVAVIYVPKLNRLLGITDGGMVLQPNKDEFKQIISNGIDVFHKLGVIKPKVALLSAAETLIPKLLSSVYFDEITKENDFSQAIIEGPLSIDISLSPEIANEKKWTGQIKGDANLLIVPDIVSGNVFSKSLLLFGEGEMAGIIMGASVPIILTSRSASATEKYASILLAKLVME
ncbi:phosphate acyltransferase [Facklamia miroungae]|uniref:Phosphate butyryltransferase n=1 Tax=Facklamia miroungae TaxID=120956 RepID=A0A1G7T9D0_9LACT|nr:phosphate acyltransferase [Facklamia miroungae]NKZ29716.1 phosphate acetyl/butyryl transferase [Facklamia miroungae]SDG31692.1 phosphate butyryltransferase [Facklamia miroungae]